MVKTIEDCQKYVDVYNTAFNEEKKEFKFNIQLENGRIIERIFKVRNFKIKLNEEKKVYALLKGQNHFIGEEGAPYCPCKLQHIDENICPCEECLDEAEELGHCHCQMYVKV